MAMNDDEPLKRSDEIPVTADIEEQCSSIYEAVAKAFDDQRNRADDIQDNWDMYFCQLGRFQRYTGESQLYWPIVRNGVNALATRYINQSFPTSGRHVECVTGDETQPYALLSLIEHYIGRSRLRTGAARELLLNGQIEGQYNCYVRWERRHRQITYKHSTPTNVMGFPDPSNKMEMILTDDIEDAFPTLDVLHDTDVVVRPQNSSSVEEALDNGGSATVIRRWTKRQIEKMRDDGEFDDDAADELIDVVGQGYDQTKAPDTAKRLAHQTGIHYSAKSKFATIYETWAKLYLPGEDDPRLCRIFFSNEKKILGLRRNPYWNDRCPIISAPVRKTPGVHKGEPPVAACLLVQAFANDMANEASDQMYLNLAPIVVADPERVANWKQLVTDVGAVWPASPEAIKMLEYPDKSEKAMQIVAVAKAQIFETLGVNPGMLPQQTGGALRSGKRNQAEIAMEQQVDILNTSDAVTVFEEEVLTPYVQWAAELDHQYRDKELTVRSFGEMGLKAEVEQVPLTQWGANRVLKWSGVEVQRNLAMLQQQIAFFNVGKSLPPSMYKGYEFNAAPSLSQAAGQLFGPRIGRQTFVSIEDSLALDPEIENQMLSDGFDVLVHAGDKDEEHIQVHMKLPQGPKRDAHLMRHQLQMSAKAAAQVQQQTGAQPQPPGPRSGATPMPGRPAQGPPGQIHQDRMPAAGAIIPPRR